MVQYIHRIYISLDEEIRTDPSESILKVNIANGGRIKAFQAIGAACAHVLQPITDMPASVDVGEFAAYGNNIRQLLQVWQLKLPVLVR